MDNAQLRFVFDRKQEATDNKKGLLQIEVRITGTSRRTFISTGIHLTKIQFSSKNGFTCKNHSNAIAITGKAKPRKFATSKASCCTKSSDVSPIRFNIAAEKLTSLNPFP